MILIIRLVYLVRFLPVRFFRLLRQLFSGFKSLFQTRSPQLSVSQIILWWGGLFFYIIDLAGLGEIYETLCGLVKWNTRLLSNDELSQAKSVFGESIQWERVRIDEKAFIGCKQWHFCYVSFYTINSWGSMNMPLLIHELTHIWQFERYGAVYIPQALKAMHSKAGYNYGGVPGLQNAKEAGCKLSDFNMEQQADIVADYFRIREKLLPKWGNQINPDFSAYEYFVSELKK